MKTCLRTIAILALLALCCAPSAAFAAQGSPAPASETGSASSDAGEEELRVVLPEVRLTLSERLMLQHAICALWHQSLTQPTVNIEGIDPFTLEAPEHIFVDPPSAFDYDGEWYFEGLIRRMAPGADGIERIELLNGFIVRFSRQADGSFRIVSFNFEPLGEAG